MTTLLGGLDAVIDKLIWRLNEFTLYWPGCSDDLTILNVGTDKKAALDLRGKVGKPWGSPVMYKLYVVVIGWLLRTVCYLYNPDLVD